MKSQIRLLIFAVALCASAVGADLTDSANVFGPRAKEVSASLATLPVWIETRVSPPTEGLKAYADAQVNEMTQRGFYVVITTQPREWRVSMNPVGLASSEGVRLAGEQMVARFKRGEFASGAISLARDLNRLANPPQTVPAVASQAAPGAIAKAWAELEAQKKRQKEEAERVNFWIWIWICVGGVATVLFCWWIVWAVNRRSARIERERLERWSSQKESYPAPTTPTPDPTEARRVFDSYTPEQRRTIIEERHHHHYSSGASTDPLMFYLLMNATMQPHYVQPIYSAPAPRYDPPARSSDDDDSRRSSWSSPSSSDSFGSSSSDSGSSCDSGSSSSDSSGGGGSW